MNILKYILLFTTMFSFQVTAETGEQVCASISFSSDREECVNFLVGRYFDIDAGWVCINARFNSGKLECVQASADKEYTLSEATACHDESFDDDRVDCMRMRGVPYDDDDSSSRARLRAIKRLARKALGSLASRNYQTAYNQVQKILTLANLED